MSNLLKALKNKMRTLIERVSEVLNSHLCGSWTMRQCLLLCYVGLYLGAALAVFTLPDAEFEVTKGRELGVYLLLAVTFATPLIVGVANMLPAFSSLPAGLQLTVNALLIGLMSIQGLYFKATTVVAHYLNFQPFQNGQVQDVIAYTTSWLLRKKYTLEQCVALSQRAIDITCEGVANPVVREKLKDQLLSELDELSKILFTEDAAAFNARLATLCKEFLAKLSEEVATLVADPVSLSYWEKGAAMLKASAQNPTALIAGGVALIVCLGAAGALPVSYEQCVVAAQVLGGFAFVLSNFFWADALVAKAIGSPIYIDLEGSITKAFLDEANKGAQASLPDTPTEPTSTSADPTPDSETKPSDKSTNQDGK